MRATAHLLPAAPVSTGSVVDYVRHVIEEAQAAADAFPRRFSLDLPGLTVNVRAFDGALADAAENSLVTRDPAGPPAAQKTLDVFIAHPGVAGISPPAPWARDVYSPHHVAQVLAEAGLRGSHFHDLQHWHVHDMERGVAVQLMQTPDAYPAWEPGAPLRPFLHWHYAEQGMRLAHCGTLGLDGRGVILAGPGGSGKSGTVIAGLLNRLDSVGDDYVLLGFEPGLAAYPLFSTLKQDPAGFRRLGLDRIAGDPRPLNWQGKHQFSLHEIGTRPIPPRLAIGALFVPRVSGLDHTTITPLARREAVLALAISSIYQMPGERESGFRFFSRVTNRLPCFRLDLGTDPAEVSAAITRFIQDMPHEN